MILVDSSVWIDYFNGAETAPTAWLDRALFTDTICIGDMIPGEVLRGFGDDKDFKLARELPTELPIYRIMTPERALIGADRYRKPGKQEIIVRKTVENRIATCRIQNQIPLLFSDRDFARCVEHLGPGMP